MKRAEDAALKAYPDNDVLFFAQDDEGKNHPVTTFGREINGFIFGYEQAEKDTIDRAIEWLRKRIDIPQEVSVNENGEPLADSYIAYAKRRLEVANEIIDDFRKAMED